MCIYLDDGYFAVQHDVEVVAGLALPEHVLARREGHHRDVLGHAQQPVPVREVREHLRCGLEKERYTVVSNARYYIAALYEKRRVVQCML